MHKNLRKTSVQNLEKTIYINGKIIWNEHKINIFRVIYKTDYYVQHMTPEILKN